MYILIKKSHRSHTNGSRMRMWPYLRAHFEYTRTQGVCLHLVGWHLNRKTASICVLDGVLLKPSILERNLHNTVITQFSPYLSRWRGWLWAFLDMGYTFRRGPSQGDPHRRHTWTLWHRWHHQEPRPSLSSSKGPWGYRWGMWLGRGGQGVCVVGWRGGLQISPWWPNSHPRKTRQKYILRQGVIIYTSGLQLGATGNIWRHFGLSWLGAGRLLVPGG